MKTFVEQDHRNERVIIGLSGGVSSMVAAYLLKIQKYELIAVTIIEQTNPETHCSVSADDLARIKDFCLRLKIPHHVIDAEEAFRERVQNRWISEKIEARQWSSLCFACHELRMELLFEKMTQLGAEYLSTGHFAKLFHSEKGVSVHSVQDLSLDQSLILQNLEQRILQSLLLPLASLGSGEVEKLVDNFSILKERNEFFECFSGELSQQELVKFSSYNIAPVISSGPSKEAPPLWSQIRLIDVRWSPEESRSQPINAYINAGEQSIKVKVYAKTLETVLITFAEPLHFTAFAQLALYKKKGGSAKVILSGKIEFCEQEEVSEQDSLGLVF